MSNEESKATSAERMVRRFMLAALPLGIVPGPLLDLTLLGALQLKMLHSLAKHYGIPFSHEAARSAIATLISSSGTISISLIAARFAFPVIGRLANLVSLTLFSGASTYALGRVFIQHFESGGTLLTFDPEAVREYYISQFDRGKEIVKTSFVGVKP